METSAQTEIKKSNTGLITVVVLVVVIGVTVFCILPVIMIAFLTIMGPLVGEVFSTINSSLMTPSP